MLRHLKIKGENKFMSLRIDDDNLFGKNETTWTKILDWKILNWILYQFMMIDI